MYHSQPRSRNLLRVQAGGSIDESYDLNFRADRGGHRGSRGIGAAIATRLAEMGAKAVILGRDRDALESVAAGIAAGQGSCRALVCDLQNEAEVRLAAKARLGSGTRRSWSTVPESA